MAWWTAALPILGSAGGALKHLLDPEKEDRMRALQSETQRLSPWTGLKADMGAIEESKADPLGAGMQGGAAGLQMMQNIDKSQSQSKIAEELEAKAKSGVELTYLDKARMQALARGQGGGGGLFG